MTRITRVEVDEPSEWNPLCLLTETLFDFYYDLHYSS